MATSKSTPTARASCESGSVTDTLTMPPSSLICEASTDSPTVAKWIASLPVSRASRSQSPANKKANETRGTSGRNLRGSFAKYFPLQSSWKTSQLCLLENLPTLAVYSETWPRAGTICGGIAYLLVPAARLTEETDCGLLPTIGANEYKGSGQARYRGSPYFRGAKMSEGLRTCQADPIYTHPDFAEASMGYQRAWTALEHLEMPSFRLWFRKHGRC